MQNFKSLRENWKIWRKTKEDQISSSTLQERVEQFLDLYQTFASSLKQTEKFFRSEREAYLTELQHRLQRLAEWQKEDGKSIPKQIQNSKTS